MNYLLTLLITYLGLFVGVLLAIISPEELPNRNHFKIIKYILLSSIILLFIFQMLSINYIFSIIAFVFLLYYILSKNKYNDFFLYCLLGFAFFYASKDFNTFLVQSALIITLGIPTGTLIRDKLVKKHWKYSVYEILKLGIYVILAFVLPYVL